MDFNLCLMRFCETVIPMKDYQKEERFMNKQKIKRTVQDNELLHKYFSLSADLNGIQVATFYTQVGNDFPELSDNFQDPKKPLWVNLGYWYQAKTYPEACAELARYIANAAQFSSEDKILDVGFGYAEQDILWAKEYPLKEIIGVDITKLHVDVATKRVRQMGLAEKIKLQEGSATNLPFPNNSFNKVVALECAFHFNTREKFFHEAFRTLIPTGRLIVADMLPLANQRQVNLNLSDPLFAKYNLYDKEEYVKKLKIVGFKNITATSIRNYVYPGMAKYLQQRIIEMKKINEISVELSEEEINNCIGVGSWQKSFDIGDYVVFTAEK